MTQTKEQVEAKANALQTEKEKIYSNKITGRRVKIKMINAQEFLGSYDVQISTEELDTNSPLRITEKADFFFENYQAN